MYQHILVPFDGSATSTQGLDEAIKLARLSGGTLRLVHLIDDFDAAAGFESASAYVSDVLPRLKAAGERVLDQGRARAQAQGVAVETDLAGPVPERLAELVNERARQWPADLIVIGTHGRRGVGRLLMGSDAEQILRTAAVPVMAVRSRPAQAQGNAAALAEEVLS